MVNKIFSKLYKYKTIDQYLYQLILDNELFFSSQRLLNDPNESLFRFTREQVLVNEGLEPNKERALEKPRYLSINNIYFFCMSKKNDDIPMWGYYGDNHRGVCLEFDFSMAKPQWCGQQKKPCKIETSHGTPLIAEVAYQKSLDEFVLAPNGSPNLRRNDMDSFGFRKLNCWQKEQEVRMLLTKNPTSESETYPKGIFWKFEKSSLKAMYFGLRTEEKTKKQLVNLIQLLGYENVVFYEGYEIKVMNDEPCVIFKEIMK